MKAFSKIKSSLANSFAGLVTRPSFRYKVIWPLTHLLNKNPDEEILEKAMRFAAHAGIKGDYLEFGVWKGRSFVKAFHLRNLFMDEKLEQMKFYAFDSFQGLPEIKNEFDMTSEAFKKGQYSCDLGTFKKILRNNGVNMEEVVIVPGWYQDTLNQRTKKELGLEKASVVFIDCDLYESTVPVLDFITDLVRDGTIVIFDDWFAFRGNPDYGEQKAFKDWLKKNPSIKASEWQKVNWKTNSFILHLKK